MTKLRRDDRIAIEDAAIVLRAIAERGNTDPDFARHLNYLPVPGGNSMLHFANAIAATAARNPTDWVEAQRRRDEAAA